MIILNFYNLILESPRRNAHFSSFDSVTYMEVCLHIAAILIAYYRFAIKSNIHATDTWAGMEYIAYILRLI